MKDISGKTAFITGGGSGMGLGMAIAFARAGMKVVIADIREQALQAAMQELGPLGELVHPVQLDVTDRARWVAVADEAEMKFGNIHILVNNAGVGVTGPMQSANYKDWDFAMSVNVGGIINGLVTMLPRMLAHGEAGHVVTTSSTGGFSAVGNAGIYCTTKFAVAGMMESLATDLQDTPIGASVFFPGPVQTSLGETTHETRPTALQNEAAPPSPAAERPPIDTSLFMSKEEVGERVLRGIQHNDLFIMSHPEFRDGIVARNKALLRAIPEEELNVARANVVKMFGTLIYNPIYDRQQPVADAL